jgi:hypothetical protein
VSLRPSWWAPREPSAPRMSPRARAAAAIVVIVVALFGWSLLDPTANIPVISPIACTVRGGSWYAPWPLPPACYTRPADPTTTTPPR